MTAVEIDRHLVPVLREVVAGTGVTVVEGDAMTLDWDGAARPRRPGWVLVANLPYNVATPLVADLLDGVPADRPHAGHGAARGRRATGRGVGDDGYGAVSVKVAYWADGGGGGAGARRRCSSPGPGSRRRWCRSPAATTRPSTRT